MKRFLDHLYPDEYKYVGDGYSYLVIWEREINKGNEWKGKVRGFHG